MTTNLSMNERRDVGGRKGIMEETADASRKQVVNSKPFATTCHPHWQSARVLTLHLQTTVACSSSLPK